MANPTSVACARGQWTLVATNVTSGVIFIQDPIGSFTYATYVATGDPAPTNINQASVGTKMDVFTIGSAATDPIDAYIWPVDKDADVKVSV